MQEDLWLGTPIGRRSSQVPNPCSQTASSDSLTSMVGKTRWVTTAHPPFPLLPLPKQVKAFHVRPVRYVHTPWCYHLFTFWVTRHLWVARKVIMRPRSPLLLVKMFSHLERTLLDGERREWERRRRRCSHLDAVDWS